MGNIIKSDCVLLGNGSIRGAKIIIDGEKIAEIWEEGEEEREEEREEAEDNRLAKHESVTDLTGYTVLPGLIDIHTHGCGGKDIMDLSPESVSAISLQKINEGVTSFCPTTVTAEIDSIKKAVSAARKASERGLPGADIIGMFIEGPYINPKYKGAHDERLIRKVNIDEIAEIIESGFIKSFSIAPELDGAEEAVKYLISKGINVRVGHSNATFSETIKAINNGANIAVHTYNAMSPLHHRNAGMVGAVMLDDRVYAELICDFLHVCPEAIKILYKTKGFDKIVLITDSMSASGMPDGKYKLGGLDVNVSNGAARTTDGVLAGSTLRLIDGVKNMCTLGIPLSEAVRMAAENPARAVGVYDRVGSITAGKQADITAIDGNFNIVFVMRHGDIILDKRQTDER